MTRKELDAYALDLTQKYQNLLAMLVAIAREQGEVTISRALVDDQGGQWMIATDPSEDGASVKVKAVLVEQPQTVTLQ